MRRKVLVIAFVIIFTLSIIPIYGTEEIQVSLNGDYIIFTSDTGIPFIDSSNRTQVPLRQSLEEIGAKVSWDQNNRVATLKKME